MPPRGLSSRRRKLQAADKETNKDETETTDAPTTSPTLDATASPTPVPVPGQTTQPTLAATTSPSVQPPTKSPEVNASKTPAPTTRDPTTTVAPSTEAPSVTVTQAPTTQTQSAATTPTQRPTMSPTATSPVNTASSDAAVTGTPTLSPIVSTSGPTPPEAAVPTLAPTLAPTFSLDSVAQSIHLQFSTWTDSNVTMEEQESTLLEILNVVMCNNGVQLIARNMTDACPPGVWQDLGVPTVIWNQPLAFVTPIDASYWRWNFTYSLLDAGNQTQDSLQGMLNESITSGRMDETLQLQWGAPSRAKVLGTETPIITGVPQQSAEILQIVGIILASLTVLLVWLLTYLARQHRHRKDAKSAQIVFSASSMEGSADMNLEKMLSQSREIAFQQNPKIPPSLLPAASSEDEDDDIALGAALVDLDLLDS